MSNERLMDLLKKAIEDIRDTWDDGYESVMCATGITKAELKELGYDTNRKRMH